MKKSIFFGMVLLAVFSISLLAAAEDIPVFYGESERYTQEELSAAKEAVMAEFNSWEGCEMHLLWYDGDEQSMNELENVNSLDRGTFDECVMFGSAFRSPKEAYGAWEADKEYVWSWTLARADKGDWDLVNWGWTEDYLRSDRYTMDEMIAGANVIRAELEKMEGTRLFYIAYKGDEFSSGQMDYVNSLEPGVYDEAAVMIAFFQSPEEAVGAWEPDTLYYWSFYLARADKGEWQLVNFGY